jgi:hypothetical protein
MRRFAMGLVLAGLLVACGQAQNADMATTEESAGGYARLEGEAAPPAPPPPPVSAPAPAEAPMDADGRAAQQPQTNQPNVPPGASPVLYLAYTYGVGLEIPSERLSGVMDQHVQACQAAGPRVCQLIGSNRSGDPESFMQGYVSIRGEPTWLRTFMAGLEAQADQAGGRIVSQTVQSEDLTRQIVDTEAHLRAQTALRDRLQDLLRSRPGRLSDLLEVERELARVQGEIDATQSNLAVMRTRVAMSELTLNYQSAPRSVGSDTLEPLKHAFADFLGIIVTGFAAIIYVIAGLIPIAVIIVPLVWLALRWRKKRGGRFFNRKEKAVES